MKHLLSFAAAALLSVSALAIPAKRSIRTVTQPDGKQLTVRLVGDETLHFYQTLDGIPLVRLADGSFAYASLEGNALVAGKTLAHESADRSVEETALLAQNSQLLSRLSALHRERLSLRNAPRTKRLAARKANRTKRVAAATQNDVKRGLVILVNFTDVKMYSANTRDVFDDMFNKVGYTGNGNSGSVHDYFYDQSYGKCDIQFDVVGPVAVSQKRSYYGGNDSYGNDKNPAQMVYEACKLVDSQVNFKDYDWDGDGEVDQVFVICAGQSEAYEENNKECIWPHEWLISEDGYNLTLDGVKIDTYGCSTELYGTSTTRMDGIGTACHEFSHCMGLPDLYDVDYSGGFGMDSWSLMDYGSYTHDGFGPTGYTAYERWVSGWLEPTELTQPVSITNMPSLAKDPVAYIVYNAANRNEYYILENRQQDGWFEYDEGRGLMITHVDYDSQVWNNNGVNDSPNHQRCTIFAADNDYSNETLYGDLYPYKSNNALTNTSKPSATLFNANTDGKKLMNKPITDISVTADSLVQFSFMGGTQLAAPVPLAATDVDTLSFTAHWQAADGATDYELEVRPASTLATPTAELASDDFDMWGTDLSADSNVDLSSKLNEYFTTMGWSGTKVFEGPSRLKLGSSNQNGSITSPVYSAPASGCVTLRVTCKKYNSDTGKLNVKLCTAYGDEIWSKSITPSSTETENVMIVSDVDEDFYVTFSTSAKRVYLTGDMGIYDGSFTDADLELPADSTRKATLSATNGLSLSVVGLTKNTPYLWRVRSVAGTSTSAWSAQQLVSASSQTGIVHTTSTETWNATTMVDVYSTTGQKLFTAPYGTWSHSLPAGAYILRRGEQVRMEMAASRTAF